MGTSCDADVTLSSDGEAIERFVQAWETGNFDRLVSMLAEDAIMSMPPWVYWLQGRDTLAAAFQHPATWEGEPRPGRYRWFRSPAMACYAGRPVERSEPHLCFSKIS